MAKSGGGGGRSGGGRGNVVTWGGYTERGNPATLRKLPNPYNYRGVQRHQYNYYQGYETGSGKLTERGVAAIHHIRYP